MDECEGVLEAPITTDIVLGGDGRHNFVNRGWLLNLVPDPGPNRVESVLDPLFEV